MTLADQDLTKRSVDANGFIVASPVEAPAPVRPTIEESASEAFRYLLAQMVGPPPRNLR